MSPLGFIGGTGPEGLGLALRFAAAGEPVMIGSRLAERADRAAAGIRERIPGARATGHANAEVLGRADRLFLTLPFDGLAAFLDTPPDGLAGKLVVDVIVPLALRAGFFEVAPVPGAASAGELIQRRLPAARVVSTFKNLSAEHLGDLSRRLEGDVLVCGNDPAARAEVASLVRILPGLRAIDVHGIGNARYLEAITALLLNLNRQHRALTSIAVLGLE
jgi:8-hydroxy-5-deazaflavin:NADPH oxidoreductase